MALNQDYLKLMAQKIVRHRNNWKDNPNRFTGLFMIIAPILNPHLRGEFNKKLVEFTKQNYNLRPQTAEKICYLYHNPFMQGQKLIIKTRIKSQFGNFDQIEKTHVNVTKLESSLRDLALWCLVTFKEVCSDQGLRFDQDELNISDIQHRVKTIL